jgi:hypothetical protein
MKDDCVSRRRWQKTLAFSVVSLLLVGAVRVEQVSAARSRTLLAYWAFNCFTTCGDANLQPESVSQRPASMSSSFEPDNGVNESGTSLNAVTPYEARSALTLRTGAAGTNNGRNLTWLVSTAGATNIQVSFATRKSSGGFASNRFQYSADGSTFVDLGAAFNPPTSNFVLVSFDLRHVRTLNDNPNAAFRIVFDAGSTTNGSEFALIDNLQVTGSPSR